MKSLAFAFAILATGGLVACKDPTPPRAAPPAIESFTADKQELAPGESVRLSFVAKNAESVKLVDQLGKEVGLDGTASGGSATLQPQVTTIYLLRVKGEGGTDAAFVQVAVGEPLTQSALIAIPPTIDSGQTAQLLWTAYGAKTAQLEVATGESTPLDVTRGSGVIEVTPERTQQYTLEAHGVNAAEVKTAAAAVRVRPVLERFDMKPGAAKSGESLLFTWKTHGATGVTLSEDTFGQLFQAEAPAELANVDEGSFTWTVPETLPSGAKVLIGQPLRFTLTVTQTDPEVAITRAIDSYVGDGPAITAFDAPAAVTEFTPWAISWRTTNAVRVQLLRDGKPFFEPLPADQAQVASGRLEMAPLTEPATFTLRAWSFGGAVTEATQPVRAVPAPSVTSFSVNSPIAQPGEPLTANWTTEHASAVFIRVHNGPTVHFTRVPSELDSGTTTIFPGTTTTLVLEAYNEAGAVATMSSTVEVGGTQSLAVGPSPVALGQTTTATWELPSAVTAEVHGDPGAPLMKSNPGLNWLELKNDPAATVLRFSSNDDAVTTVQPLLPFRFPFHGLTADRFWISTNGFVAFEESEALPNNVPLDDSGTLPAMIAPFWDDLTLGANGEILYRLEDTTFPRRLVIQWDDVRTADQSVLSFQVQLYEDGRFRFAYKTLSGIAAGGQGASIGWRFDGAHAKELATGDAVVNENDELSWFSTATTVGAIPFAPERSGVFTLFATKPSGERVIYAARANVLVPGAVVVNEAMVAPQLSVMAGKWVELYNRTDEEIDLSGARLQCTTGGAELVLPEGTRIVGGGYLVIGQSTDPALNGGAPVDVEWQGFAPQTATGDQLVLFAVVPLSQLSYSAAEVTPGATLNAPDLAIDVAGNPVTCSRTRTYGSPAAIGTPALRNEPCFDYELWPIPVGFDDISAIGARVFPVDVSKDSLVQAVSLSSAPFTYFGNAQSTVWVSSNGFLTFAAPPDSGTMNKTLPSFSAPAGTIAPLWDDLSGRMPASNVFVLRRPDHWIFQWNDFERWLSNDQLDFQVKLYDLGAIEFHYGDMRSGNALGNAWSNSATAWIEKPDGSSALPISINASTLQPHSAWLFSVK